jgi:tRNA modification GTPase
MTLDIVALELRTALDHLGRVTGQTAEEEIVNAIFSRFCIGK